MSFFAMKKTVPTKAENGTTAFYNLKANQVQPAINYFSSKVVKGKDLFMATPGIYTWILKPSGFFAIRTFSKQELGTLHANLDVYTGKDPRKPVEVAGELKLTLTDGIPHIVFNFLSGTYSKRIFGKMGPDNGKPIRDGLIQKVLAHLAEPGVVIQFLECMDADCKPEERLGGKAILEPTNILTRSENLEPIQTFFEKRGGSLRNSRRFRSSRKGRRKIQRSRTFRKKHYS